MDKLPMKAMVLDATSLPLRQAEIPRPVPGEDEVLLKASACGVCHADLHVLDGDLPQPKLPLILGHEIVGVVVSKGRMWSAHHRPSGLHHSGAKSFCPYPTGRCGRSAFCH